MKSENGICPSCDGSGEQTLDSGCRTGTNCRDCSGSGKHVRTVWTYSVGYEFKLSAGPWAPRSSDGGPYLIRENAIAAAHIVRGQLMDQHGKSHVGRYELRTHQAPVSQKVMEEEFPEKIAEMRKSHPGLFLDQCGQPQDSGTTGFLHIL